MSESAALTSAEQAYFDSAGETAPAPSPQPTEGAAQTAANDNESAEQAPQKQVPLAALHEERERRKEYQRELETSRREHAAAMARVDERLRLMQGVIQPQQPAVPEFAQDPQGHIDARLRNAEQTAQQADQRALQQQQALAHQQAVGQVLAFGRQKAAEYAAKTPDYNAAEQHLLASRTAQLRALGIPEANIAAHIGNEVVQVAAMAMQQGADPAERMYNLAKSFGYTPKAAAANADNPLETAQRGQKLATSIGSAGAAPPGKLSAESLANMSDHEFAALLAKSPREVQKIMDRG